MPIPRALNAAWHCPLLASRIAFEPAGLLEFETNDVGEAHILVISGFVAQC